MYEIFQLWPVNIRFSLETVRDGVHWSRAFMIVNTLKYVVTHPYPLPPANPKPKLVRLEWLSTDNLSNPLFA